MSRYAVLLLAPLLARGSMGRRATRMTSHAPVQTGGAVLLAGNLIDCGSFAFA